MADEVEDKTITYLFSRPIPRGAVLLGKYLAYLACTGLIVLPSVMLVYFLVLPLGGGGLAAIARGFPDLLKDLGLLGLGLAVYGAVFAFIENARAAVKASGLILPVSRAILTTSSLPSCTPFISTSSAPSAPFSSSRRTTLK